MIALLAVAVLVEGLGIALLLWRVRSFGAYAARLERRQDAIVAHLNQVPVVLSSHQRDVA